MWNGGADLAVALLLAAQDALGVGVAVAAGRTGVLRRLIALYTQLGGRTDVLGCVLAVRVDRASARVAASRRLHRRAGICDEIAGENADVASLIADVTRRARTGLVRQVDVDLASDGETEHGADHGNVAGDASTCRH